VIFVVLPLALLVVAGAVGAFIWAVHDGQYDDMDTPPLRMLHEDDAADAEPARPGRDEPAP
jgi:cbb3-type cytochrome oxidase maturation protein